MVVRSWLKNRVHQTHREQFWDAYDRDDTSCYNCGVDGPLEIHHRDGDWLNGHFVNLVPLCHRCHRRIHRIQKRHAMINEWKAQVEAMG